MFFTECERLAERHPDLAVVIEQIDAQLQEMGTAEVLRVDDFASFLGVDSNKVASVFEMLAEEGLLASEKMIECPRCDMAVLHSEYEEVLEEYGEFRCTSCDLPLSEKTVRTITTYRRGGRWKKPLSPAAQGPFYLAVIVAETVFDAKTIETSLESASPKSQKYFYRVENREIALKLLDLFTKKLGENTAAIGRLARVEFVLAAASEMDETDRFLIDEEINKLAAEVSGYRAQWTLDCLECGEPPWVHDPYDPPLYKEDTPLSEASLYHRAEQWEETLRSDDSTSDSDGGIEEDAETALAKKWPPPQDHTTAKVWTTKDGSFWMSTKTDGESDGKVEFALREDGSPTYQAKFMRLICFKHPQPVTLREGMEQVYPEDFSEVSAGDGEKLRNLLRKVRTLVSDIRTKKLAKANLNPDILPPLNIEASVESGISLRVAHLHRLDDKAVEG